MRRVGLSLFLVAATARAESLDDVRARCGERDPALERVAEEVATRKLRGAPALSSDELALLGRRALSPLPALRASVAAGEVGAVDAGALLSFSKGIKGGRACGVASIADGERQAIAIVSAPRLAVIVSPKARARAGEWIDLDARLLVPASSVRVVVLGPRGAPRSVPSSLDGHRVRAKFSADREGTFVAQIVAELSDGPRPVAELVVRVGTESADDDVVPGDGPAGADDADDLAARIASARASDGARKLTRDPVLDRLAAAHAARMAKAGRAAHDVGDGEPDTRVSAELEVDLVGENVARASTVAAAHRALWSSPSHRENLLSDRFSSLGVGVARAADGSLYVAELFARPAR